MHALVHIDGSEGGGQILRSALPLSALTGSAFVIEEIRKRRDRPGMMRQHLTAVRAAAAICGAVIGRAIGTCLINRIGVSHSTRSRQARGATRSKPQGSERARAAPSGAGSDPAREPSRDAAPSGVSSHDRSPAPRCPRCRDAARTSRITPSRSTLCEPPSSRARATAIECCRCRASDEPLSPRSPSENAF